MWRQGGAGRVGIALPCCLSGRGAVPSFQTAALLEVTTDLHTPHTLMFSLLAPLFFPLTSPGGWLAHLTAASLAGGEILGLSCRPPKRKKQQQQNKQINKAFKCYAGRASGLLIAPYPVVRDTHLSRFIESQVSCSLLSCKSLLKTLKSG